MVIQLSSLSIWFKRKKLETSLIHYTVMNMDSFPCFSRCASLRKTLWEDQGTLTGMLQSNEMSSSRPHKRAPGAVDGLGEWKSQGGAGGREVRTVVCESVGHCCAPGKPVSAHTFIHGAVRGEERPG